jgi:primosomal protein N'
MEDVAPNDDSSEQPSTRVIRPATLNQNKHATVMDRQETSHPDNFALHEIDNNLNDEPSAENELVQRMHVVLQSSHTLTTTCQQILGPLFCLVFDHIITHIDVKPKLKKNQEFDSEFDKLRFFNQKHFQIYDRYKNLKQITEELQGRI